MRRRNQKSNFSSKPNLSFLINLQTLEKFFPIKQAPKDIFPEIRSSVQASNIEDLCT